MIHDEVLNVHDWVLCYYEPFHDKIKRSMELLMDLWHLIKLKVILTLNNELCYLCSFSSIDSFRVSQIAYHACLRADVIYVPTCLRASVVYVPMCLRATVVYVPICVHANFSFLLANVPNGMPIFKFGMPTCQRTCQFFEHSSYKKNAEGNF